jgi:hypothetical protein
MNRFAVALLLFSAATSYSGPLALAQTTPQDSAHTLVTPNAPKPGRPGQVVPLPQGGVGVTTGGTSSYQTMTTPGGGSAIATPNGNGSSNVISTPGRIGTVPTGR